MRTVSVTVGPLAAASATAISLSQTAPAAQAIVLNNTSGLSSGYVVNSVATSQSVVSATTVVLNGASALASGVVWLTPPKQIVVTSAGNDTGITFTVSGIGVDGKTAVVEVLTGANASTTSTTNYFWQVNSIKTSGATASTIQVGVNGVATMDKPRQVIITSGGNDTGITFAITGTDVNGSPVSETLTGASGAAATSVLSYATITQIKPSGASAGTLTVGTNGIANSAWVRLDEYAFPQVGIACIVNGTANYTVQTTLDDPNSIANPVAIASVNWLSSLDTTVVGATASKASYLAYPALFARVLLNSGTGTVVANFTQAANVPK